MFTRRGYGDVKKSTQKVLDPKKDVFTRLKHLRALLDITDRNELKAFFETNCSQIYFIFYENFITLESNLKQKGKICLYCLYFSFQKILQLLPEKINSRWQFHSIGKSCSDLSLHSHGSCHTIRCEGMRLFLLWLQALQSNCAEEQLLIFACLIPGFPAVPSSRGPCTLDTIIYNPFYNPPDAKIVPEEISPLVPALPGEKVAEDHTCSVLQIVLKVMVLQASSLDWKNKESQDTGFRFLFSLFKKYYLPHLFPTFTKQTNLYKPQLDLPIHRPKPLYVPVTRNSESTYCTRDQYLAPRVAFITWLVNFFLEKKYVNSATSSSKNGGEVLPKIIQTVTAGGIGQEKSADSEPNGPVEQEKNHSNSSTLSDRRGSNSSLCSIEEEHRAVYDMVQSILLSTRDNVNFVNEVFHQAFLLPACEASATRKVIKVYRKWILQEKPNFMAEPETTSQEEDGEEEHLISETDTAHVLETHGHKRSSSWGRTYSFSSAISRGCLTEEQNQNVKAGIQPTLQVFLTNSANVFLLEPCQDVPKLLENQLEVCRAVLSVYRHIIMEQNMNRPTWSQLLQVLLRITEAVMKRPQENQRKDTFAHSLASILFKTIFVAWVRANLTVFISRELWDELLAVLSSLSHWEELVFEWASIMDSLTAVLARHVYGLDLHNLPLDKLSEQKEKKQRGRGGCVCDSQKSTDAARLFSLSWRSSGDQVGAQEPMRIRSATTTGAPAVEKARNNVREKASGQSSSAALMNSPDEHSLSQMSQNTEICISESCVITSDSVNVTSLLSGESVSSETSNGYLNDAEVGLLAWRAGEEEPDSPSTHDTIAHSVCLLFLPDSSEFLADDISIIAGGSLTGWHADSAFVLWRRILGILGDVNSIRCARIHAKVFSYLYELWHKLAKIRDNLGIRVETDTAVARPLFIPPLRMLASWLFKATMLPSEFKAGKLQAYKLICEMMTKHQDVLPNSDFLVHLYHVMHKGFTSDDQDVLNTMIRWCSPRFFFLGLPGFTMLVGDFITAAARVLNTDSFEAPRIEAQTVLGSLVCFPNLYQQIPSLQSVPGSEDIVVGKEDMKDYLVNILLKTARNETCEGARCVAICSLGLWVCEELRQTETHHQVKDAINVLGVTLKFGNKVVASVACDIFQLLISHWQHLQRLDPSLPQRIIEIFVATIAFLLPSAEHSTVEADKKLMVSLLLCLLDWCMAVPLSILLEPITMPVLDDPASQKAPLLDYIYRVLHTCVSGSNLHTQQSHYLLSLADLSTDYEPFLTLGMVKSFEPPPIHNVMGDFGNLLTVAEEKKRRSLELIPLTARMVMTHLVNHLGHHPLSGGPALLNSLVSENHDNPYVESSELSSEVFKSPNLQLFVFSDSTLVSYLQIPSDSSSTAAVSATNPRDHSSEVRVIVRDISGKYSWDGGILFSTLDGTGLSLGGSRDRSEKQGSVRSSKCSSELEVEDGVDVLDQLLEDLGHSSPECLPQPQLRLTQPPSPPIGMNPDMEGLIMDAIHRQARQEDEELARRQTEDPSIRAERQREPTHHEPKSPFYLCRLLLNDLGMNSWDRRKSFHLLKKNSKLLRELKHLDSRQCRETHKIAVFYIGEGQEDKYSILSNTEGSQAYEDFVSGLGWELRHLGNDEVHIVWSEHTRDYRRGIIPTDFGDVLIIIYPMKNHMFFVQIMKKPQVPFFGPLFDGAIVTGTLLPSLVRATCINASRAVKSRLTLYQSFYEERALYLEAIIQNHKENMTFEDFAAQVFSPSPSYWCTDRLGASF
uniref:Ral GTPase activating protein, alpha subunit 2 (catalytic) n=1 Tax=Cyprinus carpio TaxID=7962 RepID=A0A8C2F666_CYPCA